MTARTTFDVGRVHRETATTSTVLSSSAGAVQVPVRSRLARPKTTERFRPRSTRRGGGLELRRDTLGCSMRAARPTAYGQGGCSGGLEPLSDGDVVAEGRETVALREWLLVLRLGGSVRSRYGRTKSFM